MPCCSDCNGNKGTRYALTQLEQVFHPYFDDWSASRLIRARLTFGADVEVSFEIDSESSHSPEIRARATNHFRTFHLSELYSIQAAVELVNAKREFCAAYEYGGPQGLGRELQKRAKAIIWPFQSWRRSLYEELAVNQLFLSGGFELIDEPR